MCKHFLKTVVKLLGMRFFSFIKRMGLPDPSYCDEKNAHKCFHNLELGEYLVGCLITLNCGRSY